MPAKSGMRTSVLLVHAAFVITGAVATMLGLEKALKTQLSPLERLRLASEVGSDVPLFLIGGAVLGLGRGEQVYAIEDLPGLQVVVATPETGVSTPAAFADWDARMAASKLTPQEASAKIDSFSHSLFEWLGDRSFSPTGVPRKAWDRAEALLLGLVRTGMENDFESVVFPKHPALRELKRTLEKAGAKYAALSGSGSTVYGLFASKASASKAAKLLIDQGIKAQAAQTLNRNDYWKSIGK